MKQQSEYCPECHLVVAPFDPNRAKVNKWRFHGPCLVKWLKVHNTKEEYEKTKQEPAEV